MGTTFKKEIAGLSVHYNGLFVAMIYPPNNDRPTNPECYGLAYNNGRYEWYDRLRDARDAARKITATKNYMGKVILS